ncbi:putative TonB-dependent receptor [Sphingobium yanoikuyae]|uniref:Putative TonB-dependent receptor n=1 Tax=Sphingobium yanoikuyae TaxID=13690 RepID=A0A084E1T6_SPHYA|nr:putative TonB-dependent receptor [Sphingobium yanoikuyae]
MKTHRNSHFHSEVYRPVNIPRGRRRKLLLGGCAALLAWPVAAQAAEGSDAAQDIDANQNAASSTDAFNDAAIVVTASRRREENVQDVPIAITALSAEAIERRGDYTLSQIQHQVPTLQVFSFNPRNTNINIRGLGSNVALTNDGLENGVGIYIDNVYYGRVGQSQFDLVDLQQIEVLRGPQGTLFGKNTTSGSVAKIVKLEHAWRRLDGRNDDGFQVAPFPG